MSALLSADAPLTQEERDNLLAQEEALDEEGEEGEEGDEGVLDV